MKRREFMAAAAGVVAAAGSAGAQSKRYRACVIGDSKVGGYGHSLHRMWGLREDVEVVGLADPEPKGRAKHAKECGAARTYADYREMLDKEQPDFVAIGPRCTINHREYLLACCEVGAHGILEKPLCADLADADAMVSAAEAKQLRWSLAFNFRASPVVRHARKMIMEEGLVGEVLEIRCRGKEDHRAGAEDLIVLGVHCFDMMTYFLGDPEWASSRIYHEGKLAGPGDVREATEPLGPIVGDTVHAMYGFAGGVMGYFDSQKNAEGNRGQWGMNVYGTKGVVTIRMSAVPDIYWLAEGSLAPGGKDAAWKRLPNAPRLNPGDSPVWYYQPIIDDLVAAVEEGRPTAYDLRRGRAATAMIQAAFASHVRGRVVEWPIVERTHALRGWG